MRNIGPGPDAEVAEIAADQHGVIHIVQLLAVGLSRAGVARRAAAGRLHPVHHGVYAVGHPGLAPRGRWKAATLALGPAAVLSHRSAAVTTPARTLADLRRTAPSALVRKARREAEYRRLPLAAADRGDGTASGLEHAFLRLCRRHRLPEPEVNVRIDRYTVDFLWRPQRLVAELDGYRGTVRALIHRLTPARVV